jgi:hypothetical protein
LIGTLRPDESPVAERRALAACRWPEGKRNNGVAQNTTQCTGHGFCSANRKDGIMTARSVLSDTTPIRRVDITNEQDEPAGSIVATDDPSLIRQWAEQHSAEPATGEATESGPATVHVNDGGAGIRFNFPAAARFRPISWDEWFENFRRYELLFVYERHRPGETPSGLYRMVPKDRNLLTSHGQ